MEPVNRSPYKGDTGYRVPLSGAGYADPVSGEMYRVGAAPGGPGISPVLTQPLSNDLRTTCSGLDYLPAYEGIMDAYPGPASVPYRSSDGGDYFDGNYYGGSGYCYQHTPPPVVFPRNWVTSTGVPLASAGGSCIMSSDCKFCQQPAAGGWFPASYNGGVVVKSSNGLLGCNSCSFVYDNIGPWGLKQR